MSMSPRSTWTILLLLAAFLTLPLLAARSLLAADDKPIAIVHGTLIDGLDPPPVDDATVVLRGTAIEYAGPARGVSVPSDARMIDAKGRTVMPSLVEKETAAAVKEFEESKRNVKKFLDAGILLATGTDAPYPGVFQGEGIYHELEMLVEAGLTPLQALRAATYDVARIMKAENDWGSLVAGRRANVLIVAGHPAERISDSRKIDTVIFNGKILDRSALLFDPQRDPGFRVVPGLFNPQHLSRKCKRSSGGRTATNCM